jgi:hypothetical protein
MIQPASPFKFLDSYQKEDRNIFFGRDKEIEDLYHALSGVKHLLVYGPSGAGKTSIIECGLRNQFSDADWFALTIRRGSDINTSFFHVINEALNEKIELDTETRLPRDLNVNFGQAIEALFDERYQPVYLLFDQFEELLILGTDEEKTDFFTRLNQLIRYKVPCRVILIMREEFIGFLSEFEMLCPTIFLHRFRVEKMRRSNVHEVISKMLNAAEYQPYFDVQHGEQLAEDILLKLPDVKQEIELAHVQVFLGELWDRAFKTTQRSAKPLLHPGLIQDKDNLETVLDIFLKNQFAELEIAYGEKVPLEVLAAMISDRNTKLQLGEEELQKDLEEKGVLLKKPLITLLKDLEARRIIRTIKAGEFTQFEISHDILALVVGRNLTEEMKLRERAEDIYKVYEDRQGYFSLDDLNYLRPFEQYRRYSPELLRRIKESEAYLDKMQQAELAKARKRLRAVGSLLVLALFALLAAGYSWVNANRQKGIADEQAKNAQAALANYQSEQAAKNRLEFDNLASRAQVIIYNADGCPNEILKEMRQIADVHPDSTKMKTIIQSIQSSENCQ